MVAVNTGNAISVTEYYPNKCCTVGTEKVASENTFEASASTHTPAEAMTRHTPSRQFHRRKGMLRHTEQRARATEQEREPQQPHSSDRTVVFFKSEHRKSVTRGGHHHEQPTVAGCVSGRLLPWGNPCLGWEAQWLSHNVLFPSMCSRPAVGAFSMAARRTLGWVILTCGHWHAGCWAAVCAQRPRPRLQTPPFLCPSRARRHAKHHSGI